MDSIDHRLIQGIKRPKVYVPPPNARIPPPETWGFDPLALLLSVQFPSDRYLTQLKTSKEARKRAIQLQDIQVPAENSSQSSSTTSTFDAKLKSQLSRDAAAITIQSAWKAYVVRSRYILAKLGHLNYIFQTSLSLDAKINSQSALNSHKGLKSSVETIEHQTNQVMSNYSVLVDSSIGALDAATDAATAIQLPRQQSSERINIVLNLEDLCATKIQSLWKMYTTRKRYLKELHRCTHVHSTTNLKNDEKAEMQWLLKRAEAAAVTVQRFWRRCWDRKIYHIYRDLIKNRQQADPKRLLKYINPQEAQLVDAAAGLHLRFRLGGETFPPLIYYKIFIHNPTIDVNSFAPRDYTKLLGQKRSTVFRFNRLGATDKCDKIRNYQKDGWYQRIENNGWRPIMATHAALDPSLLSTFQFESPKTVTHHHSKLKRREDQIKYRKQKKIQWLRKLYRFKENADGRVEKATAYRDEVNNESPNEIITKDLRFDLDLNSIEEKELLSWSETLDYEKYWTDWVGLATSIGPEAINLAPAATETETTASRTDVDIQKSRLNSNPASRPSTAKSIKFSPSSNRVSSARSFKSFVSFETEHDLAEFEGRIPRDRELRLYFGSD
ncbi:hypothetical protein BKA69DRAFT_527886 [Paraphysoderma sedebokerense]|nr:hypothetical protein BKA69DRAFT_527886 [Paraphysoderma sedebokerense]